MEWFHHPDFSLTVARRQATERFLDALALGTGMVCTAGWSAVRGTLPSDSALRSAANRLAKSGFVTKAPHQGKGQVLRLTDEGTARLPAYLRTRHPWPRKWDRRWYVVLFDVPEARRDYRRGLRDFLKSLRAGCLQMSVWVAPYDIRPQFHDLLLAAGIAEYAILFEARTVLGKPAHDIVHQAWDIDRLQELHLDYLQQAEKAEAWLVDAVPTAEEFHRLAAQEHAALRRAMDDDPLLPEPIWPRDYRGPDVLEAHRRLVRRMSEIRIAPAK